MRCPFLWINQKHSSGSAVGSSVRVDCLVESKVFKKQPTLSKADRQICTSAMVGIGTRLCSEMLWMPPTLKGAGLEHGDQSAVDQEESPE